jgi:SAM-dependent methyltransferase
MWDERYSEPGYAYGTAPNDFLVAEVGRITAGGRVLCLAEGEGRNAVWLAGRGFAVTAVDQSKVGLAKAAALAAERGLRLETVQADLAVFEIEAGAWDAIVSVWAHLPQHLRQTVHKKVVQGLKPGGVLILEAYTPGQIALGTGGPRDPGMCMTLAGLREELAGLEVVLGVEKEREVQEGKYHRGRSAVVQVAAVRAG